MSALASLIDNLRSRRPEQFFNGQPDVWAWAGPNQNKSAAQIAGAIIGIGAPDVAELVEIDRADAEIWLSLFARVSLCHHVEKPETEDLRPLVRAAFCELGPDARFYSNGMWTLSVGNGHPNVISARTEFPHERSHHFIQWHPKNLSRIPAALLDGGIIAVGPTQSFLFWVCEDD